MSRAQRSIENTRVTGIDVVDGRVQAVQTSQGQIRTEIVVTAAGIWSPRIGRMVGVPIPLIPMQHQYAAHRPIARTRPAACACRICATPTSWSISARMARLVLGGYERNPLPFDVDAIPDSANPTC